MDEENNFHRDLLMEKRKKWMQERDQELKMENLGINEKLLENMDNKNKKLLGELAIKLTDKLQLEFNKEMKNNKNNKNEIKMEKKISEEVASNTCAICYELMVPPNYSPILLFPCGHTFCKNCAYKNKRSLVPIEKCPLCRRKVQSAALNISLQNLICIFTNNKHLLENVSEVNETEINEKPEKQNYICDFETQLKMCEMRYKILKQEKENLLHNEEKTKNEIITQKKVQEHLKLQKNNVLDHINKLKAELNLIDNYMNNSEEEIEKCRIDLEDNKEKMQLVDQTINAIREERDKYKLITEANNKNNLRSNSNKKEKTETNKHYEYNNKKFENYY